MAKRKSTEERLIKRLVKALPTWMMIMIICIGLAFGALVESGIIRLSDIEKRFDIPVFDVSGDNNDDTDTKKKTGLPTEASHFCVTAIDVGQGDSIFIQSGDINVLIDTGEYEFSAEVTDFIKGKKVKHLDYLIMTHPHTDHMGSMADVIDKFGAGKIIIPKVPDDMVPTTKAYEKFLNSVQKSGTKLTAAKKGEKYSLGSINGNDVSMTILSPAENAEYSDVNDYSVVIRLDFGSVSWLFTGDLTETGEKDLIKSGENIDVTALKVGHHGSSGSSSEKFLERVTPDVAVISVGKGNSYGHPTKQALSRLEEYTTHIYRTDESGNLSFYSDGEKIYTVKEKS